jgi:hypothetical protein
MYTERDFGRDVCDDTRASEMRCAVA